MLGSAMLAAAPGLARALNRSRLSFTGSLKQGSLVVGHTEAGAQVAVNGGPLRVSENGLFAFGLAFDQKSPTTVTASFLDGSKESQSVTPVARVYEVQRINGLPPEEAHPSAPEIIDRIKRENAMVAQARTHDTPGVAFDGAFDWPVPGIISGLFGSERVLNGKPAPPHMGVDIAAPQGTPIRAPADGTIVLAEPDFYLTGGTTLMDHGHGVYTVYIHQSALKATVGQALKRGEVIGLVGMKGRATGPHLHWGLNWFQMRLDPSLSTRTPLPPRA
jgi:murein DD-endopeptidase MepM/ murein hydrolase activator NlpD